MMQYSHWRQQSSGSNLIADCHCPLRFAFLVHGWEMMFREGETVRVFLSSVFRVFRSEFETIQYLVLNVVCAFICAGVHSALYSMLALNTWSFHFIHYFFTFIILILSYVCGLVSKLPCL